MKVSTRMIDGKEKDDHKYYHRYSDRLSMQGGMGIGSESCYVPSVSRRVRMMNNVKVKSKSKMNVD